MEQVVKRPRGRPPTDKTKEFIKAATRGRPAHKTTPQTKAATPNKEIIKAAPRGRPKPNKAAPPTEQKDDSMKTQMDKTESIVKAQQNKNI